MAEITFENIGSVIIEKFPEYKKSEKYYDESDKGSPYAFFGNLCLLAFTDIDKNQHPDLAERLIVLTDQILNDPGSELQLVNLLVIEVFEKMVGSRTGAVLAKKILHGESLELLKQTLKGFSSKEFESEYYGK